MDNKHQVMLFLKGFFLFFSILLIFVVVTLRYDYCYFLERYYDQKHLRLLRLSYEFENITKQGEAIDELPYLESSSFLVVNRSRDYLEKSAHAFGCKVGPVIKNNSGSVLRAGAYAKQPVSKNSGLQWPLKRSQFWLSSYYGPRKKDDGSMGFHCGIDMAAARGTPVKSVGLGVVIEATYTKGYGKTVVIEHANKIHKTRYAHLDNYSVKKGQRVAVGQKIGTVGNTGNVRGENGGKNAYHLHFEVYEQGNHIDPLRVLLT